MNILYSITPLVKVLCHAVDHTWELNDAPVTDLLRQASIKNKNQLMDVYDYSWQDTGISTGAYIIFYQGGPIDYGTHVPGPVSKSSAESDYNSACTAGMDLAIHELTS